MAQKWSRKFSQFQQCGTIRFKHRAKGLCTRCYRLVRRLEQVNLWNSTDPKSLKGYPFQGDFESFDRLKSGVITQLKNRLEFLKVREELLSGPVSGLSIECQFKDIASCCGLSIELFHGVANRIEAYFDLEQRQLLYELLYTIEENMPWKIDRIEILLPDFSHEQIEEWHEKVIAPLKKKRKRYHG